MSADRKDVFIDGKAVAAVDQRIRESTAYTRGVMTSWANPMEGIATGPAGKIVNAPVLRDPSVPHGTLPIPAVKVAPTQNDFVLIPLQGMKAFKKLLPHCFELEVRLSKEQSKMLLDTLSSMPTPKKMFDAKAIIALMEALQKKVGS